jgi:hypothetical protein
MDVSQAKVCDRFGVECRPTQPNLKLGLALSTLSAQPLNGLRHPPAADTTGWYIWGGDELPSSADFFQPIHVSHLAELLPVVVPYLGLPPGWRFQIAAAHEDVWFDAALLDVR